MSQNDTIPTETPPRRGWPLPAWFVVLAVVAFILWHNQTASPLQQERFDLINARLLGRVVVGAAELETHVLKMPASGRELFYQNAQNDLNRGTYAQRLRFVVLAGELKGANEARQQLRQIDDKYRQQCGAPPPQQAETARLLDRLYTLRAKDDKAASLSEAEQQKLRRELGWFGDLALAPPSGDEAARSAAVAPAYRTMWALVAYIVFLLLAGLAGAIVLVVLLVLLILNRLGSGLTANAPQHGIYAETFAVYMVLFLGLSYGARYAIEGLSLEQGTLLISGLAALGSLSALAWPVLRGIPWHQVRQDIGWHISRQSSKTQLPWIVKVFLELLLGAACYALAVPMLFVGAVVFLLLSKLRSQLGWGPSEFGPSSARGHPIVFWVDHADWRVWLQLLFVAAVVAPIVEETMFRGVLYRHLRTASSRWRPALSVLGSALLVSFLFAVIHPQDLLAVPALMGLALAFALMREWRGTLLPSTIAHGINNAAVTLLLFVMR